MNRLTSVRSKSMWLASVFMVVFLLFGWMATGLAQEAIVDINALTQETQKTSQKADEMTFVWWIPEGFWGASFAQDPNTTVAQAESS